MEKSVHFLKICFGARLRWGYFWQQWNWLISLNCNGKTEMAISNPNPNLSLKQAMKKMTGSSWGIIAYFLITYHVNKRIHVCLLFNRNTEILKMFFFSTTSRILTKFYTQLWWKGSEWALTAVSVILIKAFSTKQTVKNLIQINLTTIRLIVSMKLLFMWIA